MTLGDGASSAAAAAVGSLSPGRPDSKGCAFFLPFCLLIAQLPLAFLLFLTLFLSSSFWLDLTFVM